ncbi:DNA-directed DNA polymerase II large subunit [Halapricum desulfuricans]|uniref:DNA polymerase II large subunit n=1 Tax=Halapricum desulfuricans TaxID=2841257 RepID=A0A897N8B6_9EURY|nr:DNA-directed DNA polymerase II large subunit [Halapricum desulfuricans]QSG07413.1 Archaeal DNA polymerase II, large subunit [Halapricum desulfuricans]
MREVDERYFQTLESELETAIEIANEARERGGDPEPEVEIPTARDMADRVENILGIDGVAERVRELEGEMSREEAALELVEDFVDGTVGNYDSEAGKIEGAVRTAVALLTEGVVAAPIEGIDRVEILNNDDGTEFVNIYYAGPIRSAGGTAQALSVLVADYARALLGIDQYKPREEEINRYAEEVELYDTETGLQYSPKEKESRFIAEHIPIMLDGEATGDEEVSGYRDLERVDTNSSRGGMCLVFAEGIALKAPKIQRYTRNLDEVEWPWLQDLIDGTIGDSEDSEHDDSEDADEERHGESGDVEDEAEPRTGPPRPDSSKKYLRDLIAGRPVFGHPSEAGGFRLRYGRARNHGNATAGVHPATMHLVDDFLATGTQIKTERPGKAAGVVPVDSIEGPTVRLANGEVRRIDDPQEALAVRNGVEKILDLGEYLVNYGEFVENNHPLAPASYTVEWWVKELEATDADVRAMRDAVDVDLADPDPEEAFSWADRYGVPLHPKYTYLWHDVSVDRVCELATVIEESELATTDGATVEDPSVSDGNAELVVPRTEDVRETLETLLVEHVQTEGSLLVPEWRPLVRSLGFDTDLQREWAREDLSERARTYADGENAIVAINEVAPFRVRERAPTRIGNRMGRPEKSEERELSPAVHTLFPIGEAGGSQRDVSKAASHSESMRGQQGAVELEVSRRRCVECGTETYQARCPDCGGNTEAVYVCPDCGQEVEPDESGRAECPRCETLASPTQTETVDVSEQFHSALSSVGERETAFDVLKGVKGLSSEQKVPEPMEKGVLRAKHDVSAFKDGTVRYDMTDLPVTSVRPEELDVTVEQFRELGYEEDVNGDPLRHDDQLVELKVQDVVLSDGAAEHMLQTADFVDDLLTQYYGLEPYYELDDRQELVGELVFGMAPHTSAATVGRVVGFTSAAVGYAHPYFHAAKRRNCFHPDTRLWYGEDGDWRFDTIETLVEEHLTDPDETDFGDLVDEPVADVLVPSVDADGQPCRKPLEAVSKHPAPEHLIRVETEGESLTVTPGHSMLRRADGALEEVEASELDVGDRLPAFDGGETTTMGGDAAHDSGVPFETVTDLEYVQTDRNYVYNLTVSDTHNVAVENVYTAQCDGDEDCVMLLMDGLLNFSKYYLPDKRGGRMDAPLVMSSRIDPSEIDDEAHNVDIMREYPLEFYEATRELADPEDVEDIMTIAEETLGTDREYTGFDHTHDTTDIAMGPDLSAYKTLGSMEEKMDAQLELARKLRAVDETDVAERIIEYHFLPDLIGNLRAFSRQEYRCLDCGESYRRPPLSGECRECGGRVNLTVHEGSVNKYIDTATEVAEEFDCRPYTKQRLEILERSIERIFENDKNKQSGIADFM